MTPDPDYDRIEAMRQQELAWEKERERERAANWRRSLLVAGVPGKDIDAILEDRLRATDALVAAQEFVRDERTTILVLSGPRGIGKTVAAGYAVAYKPPDDKPLSSLELSAFGAQASYMPRGRLIHSTELLRVNRYSDEAMRPLETVPMLAIDDLGVEFGDAKGSFLSTVDGILNARYAARRETIITTNLPSAEFRQRSGERIIDRIRECGRFLELTGTSLRGRSDL